MGFAHAAPQVLVVLSESGGAYREATETLRSVLREQGGANTLSTVQVDELSNNVLAEADILVAVGVRAMEALAQESIVAGNRPTLNILVPRQNFESLRARLKLDTKMFTAIYLDQPLSRHLRLIKQILPSRSRVGVVLSVATPERIKILQQAAREQQLGLEIEQVSSQEEIIPALKRLLVNDKVLLALPDPLVFNKNTAQSILLTSYRAQTPLIAYSKTYVQAGALAAVFSTPTQIGQQAAEVLTRALQSKNFLLPTAQYPKYFSVTVNYQVGRSMGFDLDDEATLLDRVKTGAERE